MIKKLLFTALLLSLCAHTSTAQSIRTGADCTEVWQPMVAGKRVAMMVNQTSVVARHDGTYCSLVDTTLAMGIDLRFLMSPEHGLKGNLGAGSHVGHSHYDKLSQMPVYSLYGKTKKPQAEWLAEADVVLFDVQDVGCRFYTYLSTLYYVLEACGEQGKEVIVLDRPNPNDTIDGPVLDTLLTSFVGIIPIPILHGCTLGELAQMMLGQWWAGKPKPQLQVVRCQGWQHGQPYHIPIAPSPNLQNDHAIRLYPSLCLLEGTSVSVGRGTPWPFEVVGHPAMSGSYPFTPKHSTIAPHPLQENKLCHGYDLREATASGFCLDWLQLCRREVGDSWITSPSFFDKLAGTSTLRQQLNDGIPAADIRATWQPALSAYREIRTGYLLYP